MVVSSRSPTLKFDILLHWSKPTHALTWHADYVLMWHVVSTCQVYVDTQSTCHAWSNASAWDKCGDPSIKTGTPDDTTVKF
jgi:hypothetical protein